MVTITGGVSAGDKDARRTGGWAKNSFSPGGLAAVPHVQSGERDDPGAVVILTAKRMRAFFAAAL